MKGSYGISYLAKVRKVYGDDAEMLRAFYEFVHLEEKALDEAELPEGAFRVQHEDAHESVCMHACVRAHRRTPCNYQRDHGAGIAASPCMHVCEHASISGSGCHASMHACETRSNGNPAHAAADVLKQKYERISQMQAALQAREAELGELSEEQRSAAMAQMFKQMVEVRQSGAFCVAVRVCRCGDARRH